MAKFCTNCGKALQKGVACSCDNNEQEITDKAKNYAYKGLELVKGLFKAPIKTIKEYTSSKDNFLMSVILVIIASIITGLLTIVLVKEVSGVIFGSLISNTNNLHSIITSLNSIEIPYFRYFLIITMAGCGIYFLAASILYLTTKEIFKVSADYKKMFNLMACISIYISLLTLIAILGVYIHIYVVILAFIVGIIVVISTITLSIHEITKLEDSSIIYTIIITLVLTSAIAAFILPKFLV